VLFPFAARFSAASLIALKADGKNPGSHENFAIKRCRVL
jgi:hypothetical protein